MSFLFIAGILQEGSKAVPLGCKKGQEGHMDLDISKIPPSAGRTDYPMVLPIKIVTLGLPYTVVYKL
jgi:hypothetical protein